MSNEQRISRLTPLKQALAALDALAKPVTPREAEPSASVGQILAADVTGKSSPAHATALQDGWAVKADELADAGSYAPLQLANLPKRVETGDALPKNADAVAPLDAISMHGGSAEAVSAVTAGDGVSPPGTEVDATKPLRKVGEPIRSVDAAVFAAAGIARVTVRAPRVLIAAAREDLRLSPAVEMIGRDCAARGGVPVLRNGLSVDEALRFDDCDAIVIVGGSGMGARDTSAQALGAYGKLAVHGVGITPGETVAFGNVGSRPVMIVPGRLDGALACWLVLGRSLLARLAGLDDLETTITSALSRKIASTVGFAELVPVRCDDGVAEPLAIRNLPLRALARANGWLLVPPESEGYPAGAKVTINSWP